jgi:hypothetical protein
MSNYLPQESESEGVNPMDDDNVDAQDHSIYRLVCFSAAPLPPAPHYQDEPFIQGNNFKTIFYFCFLTYSNH